MLRRTLIAIPLVVSLAHAATRLDNLPPYREGLDALSSRLWDVAVERFTQALASPDLNAADRSALMLRIAESHIRNGAGDAALKVLADPALAGHPALPFWKAQALAAAGRFGEALALLDEKAVAPAAPFRVEALFTRAALRQTLGDPEGALETLAALRKEKDPSLSQTAGLRSAALLLELGKPDEALTALPVETTLRGLPAARARLLKARALLAKGEHATAASLFTGLLERDDPASRTQRQAAAVGLAEARRAAGDPVTAVDGLLAFLQKNENSAHLGPAFDALLTYLPAKPAPNDAILGRLESWTPPVGTRQPTGLIAENGATSTRTSSVLSGDEFGAQVLYHRALALRREGSAESRNLARSLFMRLRSGYPDHPLVFRSLLEGARWDLADNRPEQAATALDSLQDPANRSPETAGLQTAAFVTAARAAFAAKDFPAAARSLETAATLVDGAARETALLDTASAFAAAGQLAAFDSLAQKAPTPELSADLALEKALYLASRRDPGALPALERFILDHPQHPRLAEARLASANTSLESAQPDPAFARAQLDSIPSAAPLPAASLAIARMRLAGGENDWKTAIRVADQFLAAYPSDPRAIDVRFERGNACFQNKDYNEAQLSLGKLAAEAPDSPFAAPALLLAARSAMLGATSQAREQSLALFDRLIATQSPLADLARLEKADSQIKLGRLRDAAAGLDPWFRSLRKDDPLRLTAGLLLGDALYADDRLDEVLELYRTLLESTPPDSPRRFEIQYHIGLTLFEKGEEGKALDVYLAVLRAASPPRPPVRDWTWVDNCAVAARRILEDAKKWPAARAIARDHAKLGSPGSKEAEERANNLSLEHMIWDDE